MIFNKANVGCGYDLIYEEGWMNFDKEPRHTKESLAKENFRLWDIVNQAPNELEYDLTEHCDFILLNCVLCTMNDWSAHKALINMHRMLKPGGKLQLIDMDLLKVFQSYQDGRIEDIPITEGSLDARLCLAVSGYGTRDSVYTHNRVKEVLTEAGFRLIESLESSEYDSRPKESLVVEAVK